MIRHSVITGCDSLSPTLGFVAACPKLIELTIVCPNPGTIGYMEMETGYIDLVGRIGSATSELVNACKGLPYFDTLQIVHGCGPERCEEDICQR